MIDYGQELLDDPHIPAMLQGVYRPWVRALLERKVEFLEAPEHVKLMGSIHGALHCRCVAYGKELICVVRIWDDDLTLNLVVPGSGSSAYRRKIGSEKDQLVEWAMGLVKLEELS